MSTVTTWSPARLPLSGPPSVPNATSSLPPASISSQATTIGQLETVGLSWKLIDSELDELKRVTPQDIQKAARTYFTRERLSVAHVLPEESAHE